MSFIIQATFRLWLTYRYSIVFSILASYSIFASVHILARSLQQKKLPEWTRAATKVGDCASEKCFFPFHSQDISYNTFSDTVPVKVDFSKT